MKINTFDLVSTKEEKAKLPLHRRLRWFHYLILVIGFVVVYQGIYFRLWATYPEHQNFMWRWSLSNSDATSMMAMFLSIFALYLAEKKFQEAEEKYNNKLDRMADEWGFDKEKIKVILNVASRIDTKNLEKIANSYVKKMNSLKSFEDMENDFKLDYPDSAKDTKEGETNEK